MNNELLSIVSYLEKDRGVNREIIIQAIESAIQQSARRSLAVSPALRVKIDRKTLALQAFDTVTVSDEESGPGFMSLRQAQQYQKEIQLGDKMELEIAPSKLGRIAASTARQMILQKIREAERKNVYDEYKDRKGEFVSGTVTQLIGRDVIVTIDKAEAVLPAKECIPTESYAIGDIVRAYIYRVQEGANGPAVILSRACPEFVKKLFRMEVSEIADGIVEVMGVARDPGYRAKIAVKTLDEKVDPVGACVGVRGARVRSVMRELNGEKIDVIRWSPDIREYVEQALAPARIDTIEVDDRNRRVQVYVPADQLSLAIGKRGQNVKLCTKLTGWRISIDKTGAPVSFESQRNSAIKQLAELLKLDKQTADVLVQNGFLTPEGIVAVDAPYLQEVTGLDEAIADAVWKTAQAVVNNEEAAE